MAVVRVLLAVFLVAIPVSPAGGPPALPSRVNGRGLFLRDASALHSRARGGALLERDLAALALVAVLGVAAATCVLIVSHQDEVLVERLGRFDRKLGAGVHFIAPFFERVSFSATLREQVLDVPPQQCITRDNAPLTADAVVFFRVFDPALARYAVTDYEASLANVVLTQLRAEIGKLTLDETFAARQELSQLLLAGLSDVARGWGLQVTRIEVKDIAPSLEIVSAMELQMAAERKRRAQVLHSEGERAATINRAEGERTAAVLGAQARREATLLRADADREAQIREAAGVRAAVEEVAAGLRAAAQPHTGAPVDAADFGDRAAALLLSRAQLRAHCDIGRSASSKVIFLPTGMAGGGRAGGELARGAAAQAAVGAAGAAAALTAALQGECVADTRDELVFRTIKG
ncbi:hypothetical protein KFE25_008643 [Diacronema lutheri]|uniref:Band 7 domain-containing protein n=2 Tax=Diacronema lutheri TaxID=2081491 RepID=A0A8J5XX99_DIALT|nr:hypothetical protein KFE25_008643 [Diacronema lutheri]